MAESWRIAYLMRTGRTSPDLDASLFFGPNEISGFPSGEIEATEYNPSVNDVLLMATLGGFLARKGDSETGVKQSGSTCSA